MEVALLLVAVGVVWLYSRGELGGGAGYAMVPPNQAPAVGTNITQAVGAAVGALGCDVAGAAFGAPQAGAAAAPLCAYVGGKLAPYAVKGAKAAAAGGVYLAKETAKGAEFAARKIATGATIAANEATQIVTNPAAAPMESTKLALFGAGVGLNLASRGLNVLDKAPYPVRIALAPISIGTHITVKAGTVAVGAAKTVVGAAGSVANKVGGVGKSVAGAVSSVGSFVSGLGGSSKLGRAANGKDVFPNDLRECQKLGVNDWESCGLLFDVNTRKWPWQK